MNFQVPKNEDKVISFWRHCRSELFSVVRNGEFAHVPLGTLSMIPVFAQPFTSLSAPCRGLIFNEPDG